MAFKYFGKKGNDVRDDSGESETDMEVETETVKKPIRVLEALSATGLRSIRYAKEVPGLSEIVANDLSHVAYEIIKDNIRHNDLDHLVTVSHNDACAVMFESRHRDKRFHAVDLDPYGCPSTFLDTAVQCVLDGGILMVTCTDMGVLCGNVPNTCYVKYGSISLKNKACHEMALRIILQHIESHATRYKRYIVPLLSLSADFYVRVFVQIFTSASECKKSTTKLAMVYQCVGCESVTLQPLGITDVSTKKKTKFSLPHGPPVGRTCDHCGSKHRMGGPIWSAPIHNNKFVSELLEIVSSTEFATSKRLEGVLSVIREELIDVPLYYSVDRICSMVHVTSISMLAFRSAIMNAGYRVSYSHASRTSAKTDAPMSVIWNIVRAWAKQNPVLEKTLEADPVAKTILSKDITTDVNFGLRLDANPLSREKRLTRYQENPAPFWGPGCKSLVNDEKPEKTSRNQNKKRKRKEREAVDVERATVSNEK